MKRFFLAISIFAVLLTGCGKNNLSLDTKKHMVIIDTDTASDDALALTMFGKASDIEIKGITVSAGNVDLEQATKNALMTMEVAGRTDVPVYCGAYESVDGVEKECYSVFGSDGMGDCDIIHPTGKPQKEEAVDFILDTVKNNPGEIEIISLGPVTNIALAIEKDPVTMSKVKMIWSLGTAGFGHGNATPVAEFNVYADVKAYQMMCEADIPVTIVGLDICNKEGVRFYKDDVKVLEKSSDAGAFIAKSFGKFIEYCEECSNSDYVMICDPVLAASVIWDNFIVSSEECSAYVCTDDTPTYGQVVLYKKNGGYDSMPQIENYDKTVISEINDKDYMKAVIELLK